MSRKKRLINVGRRAFSDGINALGTLMRTQAERIRI